MRSLVPGAKRSLSGIFVPAPLVTAAWAFIQEQRNQGERIVCGLAGQSAPRDFQLCDRIVVESSGRFQIELMNQK